jgi:hypothetical protein
LPQGSEGFTAPVDKRLRKTELWIFTFTAKFRLVVNRRESRSRAWAADHLPLDDAWVRLRAIRCANGCDDEGIWSYVAHPEPGTERTAPARVRLPVRVRVKAPTKAPVNGRAREVAAPFKMPKFRAPKFPRRVFDIRDHGAVADGKTDCTTAIKSAITSCVETGGGRVLIPAGDWLTGPIHLASNVNLHVDEGAVVRFSDDAADYLPPVFVRWRGRSVSTIRR